MALRPISCGYERFRLEDLSLSIESGHRDIDEDRVSELLARLQAGEFGTARSVAQPTVRLDSEGNQMRCPDGLLKLADGKQWVCALVRAKVIWQDAEQSDWVTAPLLEVFQMGLPMEKIKFQDDDEAAVRLFWSMSHEGENTKVRAHSVHLKVQICKTFMEKTPGGDTAKAEAAMVAQLGPSKRSTVHLWMKAAITLTDSTLCLLATRPDLTQGYVFGNPFLTGLGEESRQRLSVDFAEASLRCLFDTLDLDRGVTKEQFKTDFCAQNWAKLTTQKYGSVVKQVPSFDRTVKNCILAGHPLNGKANIPNSGIEECRKTIEALEEKKSGKTDSGGHASDAAAEEPVNQDKPDDQQHEDVDMLADHACDVVVAPETEPEDPLVVKATELSASILEKIHVLNCPSDFKEAVKGLKAHCRGIILVDQPTSKAKIILDSLDLAWHAVAQALPDPMKYVSVGITIGRRFDLIPLVTARLHKLLPNRQPFVVQRDGQTKNKRPSYLIYQPSTSSDKDMVPTTVPCNQVRAFSWEKLRLRCTDPTCPLRQAPVPEDTDEPPHVDEEFPSDDLEGRDQGQDEQDVTEKLCEPDLDVEIDKAPKKKKSKAERELAREYKVDVWLFANAQDHYVKLLQGAFQSSQASWSVVTTRTSHPGALVACQTQTGEVVALVQGPSRHSMEHGKVLLEEMAAHLKMDEAKRLIGNKRARPVQADDIPYIFMQAPPWQEQVVYVKEVSLGASPGPFDGLNRRVSDLETGMEKLLRRELSAWDLALAMSDGKTAARLHLGGVTGR
ncbi:unnamed protein product [Symbiodinium natans]|uniref:Uncharacterized protein n=1 Tax=Symbiodinium natans TaxID=878477 RepID=A0A812SAI6_9DINO|nr:unnamed protein product [Symbiodinium natans]